MIESIHVEEQTARSAAVVRGQARAEEIGPLVGHAYAEVAQTLGAQGLGPAGPPFVRYARESMDAGGQAEVFDLAAGFPSSGRAAPDGRVEPMELPAGRAVVALHVGAWSELGEAYRAVAAWMNEHGLVAADDPWETYLDGPEAAVHRTLLTCPCREAGTERP
jgi:effector-binding domain-containing protein